MGYSEQTPNYDLPLYLADDRPSYLGDWNETMNTIDKGMNDNKNGISDANTSISNLKTYVDNTTEQLESTLTESMNNLKTEVDGEISSALEQVDNAVDNVNNSLSGINNSIAILKNRSFSNCEIIGDSWCRGYYNGTEHPSQGVGVLTAALLGISSENIHDNSVSGSGFSVGATTFQQQIMNSSTANANTELVIVIGGINDGASSANITTDVANCFVQIATKCPNAEIHFFPLPLPHGVGLKCTTPIGGNNYANALNNMVTGCNLVNSGKIHVHNGCYRWGMYFGSNASDGTTHLNQRGYQLMSRLCASLIRDGGDFWPTFNGVISNYNGNGEVQRDTIIESNGMIYLALSIQCTQSNPIGTKMNLPDWAAVQNSFFYGLAGSGSGSNSILAFEGTDITLQFNAVAANEWMLVSHSWIAGM